MKPLLAMLLMLSTAAFGQAPSAPLKPAPPLQMWRLDCGTFDIDDLEGRGRVLMPVSCYLIRHGDQLVLFDAGLNAGLHGQPRRETGQTLSLDRTLAQQLAQIAVDPAKVNTLVVSHYHGDHHGQADLFPNARLIIGAGDAAAMRKQDRKGALAPWIDGQRSIEEIAADRDVTGDGSVIALFSPGHTPGHLAMLVKLERASYLLTGDLVHSRRQLAPREPSGNHVDKVRGKAEIERLVALAERERATIVVGHERDDVALLPAFPAAAR